MASEELRHVARLRRERRSAYHADRPVESGQPVSMHDLSALERRLADQLDAIAALAGPSNAPAVRQFAIEARATADELTRRPLPVPRRAIQEPVPEEAAALLELLVDRYLEAAEGPADEEAKLHAQTLAGRAINRLAWLRRELPARHS
jgi:hypothetical protein